MMQLTINEILISFFLSFLLNCLLTPLFRRAALFFEILDRPNQNHKTHTQPTPYLGGLPIIATLLTGLSMILFLKRDALSNSRELVVLITAPLLLGVLGLLDDIRNLGAIQRLFVQSILATIVSLVLSQFGWYGSPTQFHVVNVIVSILWIVGITNAMNFIDNLDGGAGGVAFISSTTLVAASIIGNQYALSAISALIAGATLGFLAWNIHPAKIYLGDSGALFLGSLLAVLTLRFDPSAANPVTAWLFAALVFAVPILDTSVAVMSRLRRDVSPFQGAKDHLSHRLLNLGYPKMRVAVYIWTLQVYFSTLALLLLFAGDRISLLVALVAGLSWLFCLGFFFRLSPMFNESSNDNKK